MRLGASSTRNSWIALHMSAVQCCLRRWKQLKQIWSRPQDPCPSGVRICAACQRRLCPEMLHFSCQGACIEVSFLLGVVLKGTFCGQSLHSSFDACIGQSQMRIWDDSSFAEAQNTASKGISSLEVTNFKRNNLLQQQSTADKMYPQSMHGCESIWDEISTPIWVTRMLSLVERLDIASLQRPTVRVARTELENCAKSGSFRMRTDSFPISFASRCWGRFCDMDDDASRRHLLLHWDSAYATIFQHTMLDFCVSHKLW